MSLLCQCYQSILLGMWEFLRHMLWDLYILIFFHSSKFIFYGSFSFDKERAYLGTLIGSATWTQLR